MILSSYSFSIHRSWRTTVKETPIKNSGQIYLNALWYFLFSFPLCLDDFFFHFPSQLYMSQSRAATGRSKTGTATWTSTPALHVPHVGRKRAIENKLGEGILEMEGQIAGLIYHLSVSHIRRSQWKPGPLATDGFRSWKWGKWTRSVVKT